MNENFKKSNLKQILNLLRTRLILEVDMIEGH